jgi:homoserine dehydrogenase
MGNNKVRVGIVGFGTVGTGVAKLLLEDAAMIRAKTGLEVELVRVVDVDTKTTRSVSLPEGMLTDDIDGLLSDETIDIGVELVGGTTAAKDIQLKLLQSGKHVVTANKALLAEHGTGLFKAAREKKLSIAFEASCAGGIPIISVLRTGLAANRIDGIYGILNGTCNFILSNMSKQGLDFPVALSQAQEKGYAESDPTLDINGSDSAHKLSILSRLAFGCEIKLSQVWTEGIEDIQISDIRNGDEMGYVLKLLAIGERDNVGDISLRVHPAFISKRNALAHVDGPFNAISVFSHAVGNTIYLGRGAGMMATASAVVADIIEIGHGNYQRVFTNIAVDSPEKTGLVLNDISTINSRFYIRLMAKDEPGVVATYGKILGDHEISISGAIQHEGSGPDNTVPVVITTHPTRQKNMFAALSELEQLDVIGGKPVCIRIVDIPEDKD